MSFILTQSQKLAGETRATLYLYTLFWRRDLPPACHSFIKQKKSLLKQSEPPRPNMNSQDLEEPIVEEVKYVWVKLK